LYASMLTLMCSGVIAAAVRVWAGVLAFTSEDKTFTVAEVALWCLAEITSGFVIFCAPMAPKVFGRRGLLFGRFRSSAGTSEEWTSGSNKFMSSGGGGDRYVRVEGPSNSHEMPLRSLAGARYRSQMDEESLNVVEGAILRVTRVEIQHEYAKNAGKNTI
jgi:hypothetical protein